MSMSDQYDDGRYDGQPADEMNPGYLVAPGGWCVPAEQAPEPFMFPRIPRGGIKYPTPTKENAMPRTKQQELAATNKEIEGLLAKRERLAREIRQATDKPAPPADQSRWCIDVRFNPGGTLYSYLVLRHGVRYYTTGTGDTAVFNSWKAFLRWLDADVAEHSALIPLESDFSAHAPIEGKSL